MNWWSLVLIAALVAACGGQSARDLSSTPAEAGTGVGGSAAEDSSADEPVAAGGTGGGSLDAADGGDVVDPESCEYPVKGIHACCENKLCRGMCHPKTGTCWCGAIEGGCWESTACCGSSCSGMGCGGQ